jgi:dTDP-4-dehydrorhamnose 3,5-epimerase
MRFIETVLPGVWVVELEPRIDERGYFARAWCAEEFRRWKLNPTVAQTSLSLTSRAGTVRGLHYQRPPAADVKFIRCVRGAVCDVVLDLRAESATRGRWVNVELTADNNRAVYVPEGCAHGLQTLVDDSTVFYQMSYPHTPEAEAGVRYDDPAFNIHWPLPVSLVSARDLAWSDFRGFDGSDR